MRNEKTKILSYTLCALCTFWLVGNGVARADPLDQISNKFSPTQAEYDSGKLVKEKLRATFYRRAAYQVEYNQNPTKYGVDYNLMEEANGSLNMRGGIAKLNSNGATAGISFSFQW